MNLLRDMTEEENGPAMAAFRAKLEIYREATHAYGFAFTRTRNICTDELGEPMQDQVRLCIVNDALPHFLEDPSSIFRSRRNSVYHFHATSLAAEEGYDLSNTTSRGRALR